MNMRVVTGVALGGNVSLAVSKARPEAELLDASIGNWLADLKAFITISLPIGDFRSPEICRITEISGKVRLRSWSSKSDITTFWVSAKSDFRDFEGYKGSLSTEY